MAKINGIQIKNIKTFKDHEGCPIAQGTVYYKGKKLGEWSQDSWGGPDIYRFDERILNEELEKFKKSDLVDRRYREFTSLDSLLGAVINLADDEKSFKRGVKKGYTALVLFDNGCTAEGYFCMGTKAEIRKSKNFADFCIGKSAEDIKKIRIYTCLEDFDIAV